MKHFTLVALGGLLIGAAIVLAIVDLWPDLLPNRSNQASENIRVLLCEDALDRRAAYQTAILNMPNNPRATTQAAREWLEFFQADIDKAEEDVTRLCGDERLPREKPTPADAMPAKTI